jgi:hypothetical protein
LIYSILLCLFQLTTFSQTAELQILGNWKLTKSDNGLKPETKIIPLTKSEDSKPSETLLFFYKNGKIDYFQQHHLSASVYILRDSILIIGYAKYIILDLTKDQLIFKDYENFLPTTYYYERTNKKIEDYK